VATGLYRREKDWIYKLIPVSVGLFFAGVAFMYTFVLLVSLNFLIGFTSWFPLPDPSPTALERAMLHDPEINIPASQPAASQPAVVPLVGRDPVAPPVGSLWFNAIDRTLKVQGVEGTFVLPMQRADQRSMITTHFKIGEYLTFVLVMTVAFGLAFQIPLVVVFLVRTGIVPSKTLSQYRKVVILLIVIIAGMIAPPDLLSHILLSGPMILLFEIGLYFAKRGERRTAYE
ncbi:MAG: twin-arginine translocase subunit TatC, partial [Phycisphaerae bacterium]